MDRYQVVKKIGEGSFGKALLVRSRESGKNMVVKEINMARMTSKERNEAKKETAVLAQLHHPNIVAYRESFEENRNLYIVMDYCDGGDLYGRINAQRGILFPEDQILDWFVQITLSLKHIHDRKILHRDIKSQNIFLTKHGIVKLGDFGIAKVLNSTVELARTCIGTPYYLSPEICENKPYNNKSDVWSLGCVLYELTTLKHAFEAGNMKNLVLKIIRGSYPPVSPKYSYELRSLIAQLFKRSPRDRPSINNILRKSLLQNRIRKFLTDSEMAEEFSHTVMHGKKLQKALPSGANRPTPVLAKRPPSAAATPRYNPAAVYGQPVRISKENRRSSDAKRPSSADVKRPISAGPNREELQRRKQELIERERKRREMAQKKEVQRSAASRHQELMEKQRAARLNKAREEGWKNLVDSLGSDESEKRSKNKEVKKVDNRPPSPKPVANAVNAKEAAKDRGNYDQYHAWLSDLEKKRNVAKPCIAGQAPAVAVGRAAGAKGAEAAEKAKVVHEYLERKKQAAANRARGQADVWGGAGVGAAIAPKPAPRVNVTPKPQFQPPQQEDEYLARLRQIRLQNFNERRVQKEKMAARVDPQFKPGQQAFENEVRRKKVEALRQQAEERAEKLKQQLERQQRNQYKEEHNKQLKGDAEAGRNGNYKSPRPAPQVKPTPAPRPSVPVKPAISMTAAMQAIGAAANEPQKQPAQPHIGMTAAMQAIGGAEPTPEKIPEKPPSPVEQSGRSPLQKKKDEILKKLNSKLPAKPSVPERPQWGQPVKPAVVPERPKWEEKTVGKSLAELSLEETASHMEATCVEDKVVKHEEDEEPASSRKQWAGQANTVLNILQGVELGDTLQTLDSQASTDSTDKGDTAARQVTEGIVPSKTPATTITISKTPSPAEADKIKAEESPKAPIITEESPKAPVNTEVSPKALVNTEESSKDPVDSEESPEASVETEELPKGAVNAEASPKAPVNAWIEESPKVSINTQTEESTNAAGKTEPSKSAVKAEELPTTPERKSSKELVEDKKTPLFDRVALEETEARADGEDDITLEDLDDTEDTGIKDKDKAATLLAGLTTGHFDVDVKMLRTCSEPDLTKLFRTDIVENPFFDTKDYANASINVDLDMTDEENEDDSDSEQAVLEAMALVEETLETPSGEEKDEEAETGGEINSEEVVQEKRKTEKTIKVDFVVGGEEEEDDEEEDEDLETMRESMMSLLQSQEVEDETVVPKKKTVKKKKMRVKRKKPKVRESKSETTTGKLDTSSVFERQMSDMSNGSEEDLRTMKETMKSLLRDSLAVREKPKTLPKPGAVRQVIPEAGPAGDAATVTAGPRVVDSIDTVDNTLLEGKEAWQSDSDEDDQYFEEDDNMFCRLEESRAKLEEELGEETFLKAYKTVQAIHEDEDDRMEEGMSVIGDLLGEKHSHLYNSILGLVMADGAFMEDNE